MHLYRMTNLVVYVTLIAGSLAFWWYTAALVFRFVR